MEKPIEQLYDYPPFDANGAIPQEVLIAAAGGGGGNMVDNTPSPAPAYVPPVPTNPMTIHLIGEDTDLEFLENGVSKGYGRAIDVTYSTNLEFNGPKTYTANLNNGVVLSKFIVETKSLQYAQGVIDGIGVTEYKLVNGNWEQQQTQNFNFGSIALRFKTTVVQVVTEPAIPSTIEVTNPNPNSQIEIAFGCNLQSEVGNSINLSYQIVYGTEIVDSGLIGLGNNILKELSNEIINKSTVNFEVRGNLPDGISIEQIYSGLASQFVGGEFNRLNKVPYAFSVPASQLRNSFLVIIDAAKEVKFAEPKITLGKTQYTIAVKESDTEKPVSISFNTQNADRVLVYIDSTNTITIPASDGVVTLQFQKDFKEVYGTKKVILVAESNNFGTGQKAEALITFTAINDFPSITEITFADKIDVPSFSDFNIEYEIQYSTFATTSVDVWLKQKNGTLIGLFSNQPSNGVLKINLKKLRELYPNWIGSDNVSLVFKPYNKSGAEELIGNEYEIVTQLILPTLQLDEDIIKSALFQAFSEKLNVIEPEADSKYLTHLANFGDNEQIIISSWENDNWTLSKKSEDELGNIYVKKEDEVESIILKLYSPLPANIVNNSTFWITKLMTNPLIETVVLNEQDDLKCPPLKGPNFNIDIDFIKGESTNYESLDNLILSGSTSSTQLISTYLSSSLMDTTNLNIDYVSGSEYVWNSFVHFSSAKERVDNFVYKVQLIETYETAISASYYTGSANSTIGAHINSLAANQERDRNTLKKNQLIQGFDGFENFLYTSSSMSWPYVGNVRQLSTSNAVTNWYEDIIDSATTFDLNNQNWVQNNIPQYIVNNGENESLLLFFSMIGHHFDNIYFHTKAIERSRGLGYKSKDGISDKLLFDVLKSFGWDAHNLAADEKLWKYVFGVDSEGTIQEENPAKQRTYEVWRRIVNNLPYLLKHKGTRRGVYALLSCYGIPSSNLSILEFGGPEVTTTNKSKLVYDNITTALKMNNGSKVELEWKNTDKGRKPNTIELFTKPASPSNYTLISGSGWNVQLSGSANSDYGKVIFNYSGSTSIETSLLPLFNGRFFGVSVSSGSTGLKLDVRQSEKERTIFQESVSAFANTNWNAGSTLHLGGNYSGSVDEFRLWSDVLDTERFYEHVSFPEMINGNHTSSSTDDLYFRLDFEYPKNLNSFTYLPNVDANIYFSGSLNRNDYESGSSSTLYSENTSPLLFATASGFDIISTYPYNFEAIDRTVVLEIPDMGSTRYSTNKVRFEEQTLVSDLSSKSRATKKSFDQSPVDSNRVGLFFSPTKELNIDIAKSFGGINLDNYIGDPSDVYKSNYSRLDYLRNYYFQRFDGRDIYAYINLIKLYEKSMFEDIKKMLPARVKATTGLLIEPHILERSKIQHKKPTGDEYQQEVTIHYADTTIFETENIQKEVTLDTTLDYSLVSENNQYETLIQSASTDSVIAENYQYNTEYDYTTDRNVESEYYQREVDIETNLDEATILSEVDVYDINTIAGQSDLETIGFGIYAEHGHAIRTYFDKNGRRIKERIKVDLVKEEKTRDIVKFKVVVGGKGDPRGGMELTSSVYYETKLNIQPYSGSKDINPGTGSIVEVTPLHGYLPTHHRNTSDLTKGLKNSYYLGSKNTAATTLDGTPPVETFTTNPNTLKVNKAGRDSSEPILEVE